MSTADVSKRNPPGSTPSAAEARILAAALALFAQHGVAGTSLQMIADDTGITKAAVYYHYKTKDEIVRAAAENELARMEGTIDAAEHERTWEGARGALIANMIALAVERRRTVGALLYDPAMARLVPDNQSIQRVMGRMTRMLMGNDAGPDGPIRTATLIAAISGTAMSPLAAELDDDSLRAQLLHLALTFLEIPD